MDRKILGWICFAVTLGLFYFGLRPFGAVPNEVSWLPTGNGLRFGYYATIIATAPFTPKFAETGVGWSVELWLEPGLTNDTSTLITFDGPVNGRRVALHQYNRDLGIEYETGGPPAGGRTVNWYVAHVFEKDSPVFLAITGNAQGSKAYVNGSLAGMSDTAVVDVARTGRMVVGTATDSNDSWSGILRGLALYQSQLSAAAVARDYDSWTGIPARPESGVGEGAVAQYLFAENHGQVVRNQITGGPDLFIPAKYLLLHQRMLQPLWREFNNSPGYRKDALINLAGFVPYGFLLCGYFAGARTRPYAVLAAIVIGVAVSLTIEIVQSYLPTRDSSSSDLLANALGTVLGAAACRWSGYKWFR